MAPRNADIIPCEVEDDLLPSDIQDENNRTREKEKDEPLRIVWRNAILFFILHLMGLYGIFQIPRAHPLTLIWGLVAFVMNGLGITAGAHRLWAHKSYRAKLPLQILLAIFNSMAFQNDIIEWSRDHRAHHKFSETNADPHNAKRGFFFAHCGWLMCRKHTDVKVKGAKVDLSDLLSDPVCQVQRKFYLPSVVLFCFVLPTVIPMYFWGESFVVSYFICAALRYAVTLNMTWLVNSAAHMWGNKPYDKFINPAENFFVAFGAIGEGYHNYHHVFPGDYSTSEHGWRVNFTTFFIDCMSWLGLAYNCKKMSHEVVFGRKRRTGDKTEGFGVQ